VLSIKPTANLAIPGDRRLVMDGTFACWEPGQLDRSPAIGSLIPSWHLSFSDSQIDREIRGVAIQFSSPDQTVYTRSMSAHIIGNPVPTPEEMGQILGLSSERVAAVRRIMSTTGKEKASGRSNTRRMARKQSTRARRSNRTADGR
jgi:hypothetical protein